MPLLSANVGESYTITRIGGTAEVRKHLEDLGFAVGGKVTVISVMGGKVPGENVMPQEPLFYHGSILKGLNIILANAKSHVDGSQVAYFTTDRVYALVCCRSRQENFVTMGLRDGIQTYFERFPADKGICISYLKNVFIKYQIGICSRNQKTYFIVYQRTVTNNYFSFGL